MRTVGQILREERIKKGFSLEQVEKATRIRLHLLHAVEADEFKKMPAKPYIHGFIKNYSDFLGLPTQTMLALFRRQFTLSEKIKPYLVEEPLIDTKWRLTPNKVIAVLVVLLILLLFSYFYSQYQALHQPPPLELISPKNELVVKDDKMAVFGDTDTDATVTINNQPVIIKENGKFYKDIELHIGNNTIIVEATSRVGEKTTIIRQVTRLTNR